MIGNPSSSEPFWIIPTVQETAISRETAQAAAKRNDVCVYSIGRMAGEGGDRTLTPGDWYLSETEQANVDLLCETFHKAGKKVIVLLNMGNIVDMGWNDLDGRAGGRQQRGRHPLRQGVPFGQAADDDCEAL